MSHLGDRVTDLVDGRLAPDAADRARAHLMRCRACRDEVETERLTKQRLAVLPAPALRDDLLDRLLTMGGPAGPLPPRPARVPGTPRSPALPVPGRPGTSRTDGSRPAAGRPRTRLRGRSRTRPPGGRRGRVAVAVLGGFCAVGGLLFIAQPGQAVVPPLDSFVEEHADTTGTLPFGDLPAGWSTGALTSAAGVTAGVSAGGGR